MDLRRCYEPSFNDTGRGLDADKQGLRVIVLYPGYHDDGLENRLLDLIAPEPPDGGLYHGTAWIACCVVACNRFDGYLSTSKGPESKVQTPYDTILAAGTYYFLLPTSPHSNGDEIPYPICASFRDWKFPHHNRPPMWNDLPHEPSHIISGINTTQQIDSVRRRDGNCRVSNSTKGLQVAHIIPKAEDVWFSSNCMTVYNRDSQRNKTIMNVSNLFLLRGDLHTIYDAYDWVILPKECKVDVGKRKLVFHQLRQSDELAQLYHNKRIHCIRDVSIEYLLARFACAIFPELESFLRVGRPRWLTKVLEDGSEIMEWCTWPDLVEHDVARTNRQRNRSSQKRDSRGKPRADAAQTYKRKYQVYDPGDSEGLETPPSASEPSAKRVKGTVSSATPTNFPPKSSQQLCICNEEDLLQTPVDSASTVVASCIVPETEKVPIPCPSSACKVKVEWDRHSALIERALSAERSRSKTGNKWKKEKEWAKEIINGPMDQGIIRKWFWVMGNDNYREDDSLEFVNKEVGNERSEEEGDTCAVNA